MNLEKEMVEKRNDLIVRAKEIVNTAETEKRELTGLLFPICFLSSLQCSSPILFLLFF